MSQGKGTRRTNETYDTLLELKAAGLVAASAAGSLILDLGGGGQTWPAVWFGDLIVDVSAIEVASLDEGFTIVLSGSSSPTFASGIEEIARLTIGSVVGMGAAATVVSDIGRYVIPVCNERNGRTYRYFRIFTIVAGTIATGINYSARLGRMVY